MSRSRIFSVLLIFFVVGVIALVFTSHGYKKSHALVSITPIVQTPIPIPTKAQSTAFIDDTAPIVDNMKEYVSNQYGFSLSYPYDWQILDEPNVTGIEIEKVDGKGSGFSISVRILDNPNNLPVIEFAKLQSLERSDGTQDIPQEIMIAGTAGYKLSNLPESLLTNVFITYKGGKVMNIFAGGEFDKKPKTVSYYTTITNKVIQSLKIL